MVHKGPLSIYSPSHFEFEITLSLCRMTTESRCSSDGSDRTRANDSQNGTASPREYLSAYQSIAACRAKGCHGDDNDSMTRQAAVNVLKSKVKVERRRQADEPVTVSGYPGLTIGQLTREVAFAFLYLEVRFVILSLQVAKTAEKNVFVWRDKTLRLVYNGQCRYCVFSNILVLVPGIAVIFALRILRDVIALAAPQRPFD
jgi:hypothetical protein